MRNPESQHTDRTEDYPKFTGPDTVTKSKVALNPLRCSGPIAVVSHE